ncbi:hypothetical protein FDN13_12055 [Caloramator sp. E03]|uniref:alginate lyase family protein n=1 Tax=Caloramator sp. E03 TaxID=2576307 RepID=UPI001110DD26|nr:alginate lyase family protein [Caloramator sp. E03]QCX34375.1 hypothetical protein FDN13_12055 [Caloramator sp. E03]
MSNIIKKFSKYKNQPIRKLTKKAFKKIKNKIYFSYRRYRAYKNPIDIPIDKFYSFYPECSFFYDFNNREKYIEEIKKLNLEDSIIRSANLILEHKFNLLGSGEKYLGEKLPWNEDFKTGFKWENKFYKDIKIVDLNNNADVKVPWELSRFQHLFTLGKAYILTCDEKYALEFKNEIEDWILNNPVEMSVNWTCTMDVAIRAVNWILGYFMFNSSKSINMDFWTKFNKSLYLHGRFIYKNLENYGEHYNNHYLSDLAGLIWLGIYFGDFYINDKEKNNNPKDWLKYGISEFEKEMKKEVNIDGTDYESSTSYHRLVTELFLITTILCSKNNINFSIEYIKRLEKMCEFIMQITKPNGKSPLIGDADDGRLVILSDYHNWDRRDFRHILSVAGEYFDRDDFRYFGKDFREDALWILGSYKDSLKEYKLSSIAYNDGGYYILRNDKFYCLIRCGQLSCRGEGGHSHNDQLSIELNVEGEDFIIDPGSYLYTADYKMRNVFRSTNMHSTLYIEGFEQNEFNPYDLFYMKEETFGRCLNFTENIFFGEHYGYYKKCGVIHQRRVKIKDEMLEITDTLKGDINNKKGKYFINFILDKGVEIKEKDGYLELLKNNKRLLLEFQGDYIIEKCDISYSYGCKTDGKRINIKMIGNENKIYIRTDLYEKYY